VSERGCWCGSRRASSRSSRVNAVAAPARPLPPPNSAPPTAPLNTRWLAARSWSPARAARDLAAHAAWRAELVGPRGRVLEADVANEIAQRKVLVQGPDRRGRGIIILNSGNHYAGCAGGARCGGSWFWSNAGRSAAAVCVRSSRGASVPSTTRLKTPQNSNPNPTQPNPRSPTSEVTSFIAYYIDAGLATADRSVNPNQKCVGIIDMSGFGMKNFDTAGAIHIARTVQVRSSLLG